MAIKRVGILQDVEDPKAPRFHRAAVVVTRNPHNLARYGRAAAGHLGQESGVARIPDVAACVVWGSDETKVAGAVKRNPHATMIVVVGKKPKAGGPLMAAMERVATGGSRVEVVVLGPRTKACGWDIGENKYFEKVTDMTRMPQEQTAPSIPMKYRKMPRSRGKQAPSSRKGSRWPSSSEGSE